MNPKIPWIYAGYQNKLLGAVWQTDYIGDLITRPAATQATFNVFLTFQKSLCLSQLLVKSVKVILLDQFLWELSFLK